mmetsp:Transcript_107220/g.301735  ORF Transcript_107220/g.301735 Transcript_107220/m.301735 type:complete len:264 (-) Transcript_107220:1274-2065(-)
MRGINSVQRLLESESLPPRQISTFNHSAWFPSWKMVLALISSKGASTADAGSSNPPPDNSPTSTSAQSSASAWYSRAISAAEKNPLPVSIVGFRGVKYVSGRKLCRMLSQLSMTLPCLPKAAGSNTGTCGQSMLPARANPWSDVATILAFGTFAFRMSSAASGCVGETLNSAARLSSGIPGLKAEKSRSFSPRFTICSWGKSRFRSFPELALEPPPRSTTFPKSTPRQPSICMTLAVSSQFSGTAKLSPLLTMTTPLPASGPW